MLYAEMRVPKDVRHLFNQAKFSQTLKTHSFEIAEERKLSIISNWKAMVRAARQTFEPQKFEFDNAVKSYSETFKALGGGDDAAGHLAHQLNPMTASTAEEQEQRRVVFGASTGKGLATSLYLDEWMGLCEYNP